MQPFKSFSHVSVTVSDLEKAKAFYGGVLGLKEIPRPDFPFAGVWYSLGGDFQLHIIVNETWQFPPTGRDRFDFRAPHFALLVEDADEVYGKLKERGYPFRDVISGPTGLRQIFVHDSDGNMVELLGPSRQAAPARYEKKAATSR